MEIRTGTSSYAGSARNGLTTYDYGAWFGMDAKSGSLTEYNR